MIKLVKATKAHAQPNFALALEFSDGSSGVLGLRDFVFSGGQMVDPLKDPAFFSRVFVEMGVPTWPNGCDIDPTNARLDLEAAGALSFGGVAA